MAMQFWPLWSLRDRGLWRTDLAAQRRGARTLQEASMFGRKQEAQKTTPTKGPTAPPATLLTVVGDTAKMEGKFQIADSIQIECEVGGELRVGGKLVIGEKGVVNATVETVDAIILGYYDGSMTATGNVEIKATGRVSGNIKTDSLVIAKGGSFRGNVAKINEEPAATHRPLYRIEDKLAGQIARDNSQMSEHARLPEVGRKV
jgi:cytoskeletal protein CcmA (bactofilin family)